MTAKEYIKQAKTLLKRIDRKQKKPIFSVRNFLSLNHRLTQICQKQCLPNRMKLRSALLK